MAQHRQQNKDNSAILKTSTQQTNKISTATSATVEKKRFEWISFINLILTAIIGLGGLAVGLYLNSQNERIQIELVQLQANLQRQANLAHLEVNCSEDCYRSFQIKNSGLAIANKIRIAISIFVIEDPWRMSINDISQFELSEAPSALNFNVMETKIAATDSKVLKNNEYILTLENLPPGETAYITIFPDFSKFGRLQLFTFERKNVTVYLDRLYDSYSSEFIGPYFNNKFSLATLNVSADCDNCIGETTYNSDPGTSIGINVSAYLGIYGDFTNFQMQHYSYGYKMSGTYIKTNYMLPIGQQPISAPDPLYLQVTNGGTNDERVVECQASDCTQF